MVMAMALKGCCQKTADTKKMIRPVLKRKKKWEFSGHLGFLRIAGDDIALSIRQGCRVPSVVPDG
jgi:hypothetical protein